MLNNFFVFNHQPAHPFIYCNFFLYSSKNKNKNNARIGKNVAKVNRFSPFRMVSYKTFYLSKLKLHGLKKKRNFKSNYSFSLALINKKAKNNSIVSELFKKNKFILDKSIIINSG
jgi:hypothetical protein